MQSRSVVCSVSPCWAIVLSPALYVFELRSSTLCKSRKACRPMCADPLAAWLTGVTVPVSVSDDCPSVLKASAASCLRAPVSLHGACSSLCVPTCRVCREQACRVAWRAGIRPGEDAGVVTRRAALKRSVVSVHRVYFRLSALCVVRSKAGSIGTTRGRWPRGWTRIPPSFGLVWASKRRQ